MMVDETAAPEVEAPAPEVEAPAPAPQQMSAEEAYRVVLETERNALVNTCNELKALQDAIGSPLGAIVRDLPKFAGPRSAPITKIRGFSMTLQNWPNILGDMISQLNREIAKYDADINGNLTVAVRGGRVQQPQSI